MRNCDQKAVGVAAVFLVFSMAGCAHAPANTTELRIDGAIRAYAAVAENVDLGDSQADVLRILEPTQADLLLNERKFPDRFLSKESRVDIYYFRSRRKPDGRTTDDEFTPYAFLEGRLVSVGWLALGGPNADEPQDRNPIQGQAPSPGVVREGGQKVYDVDECIGPIVNGVCHGTILPRKAYHPTCHGVRIGGQCTGPEF